MTIALFLILLFSGSTILFVLLCWNAPDLSDLLEADRRERLKAIEQEHELPDLRRERRRTRRGRGASGCS